MITESRDLPRLACQIRVSSVSSIGTTQRSPTQLNTMIQSKASLLRNIKLRYYVQTVLASYFAHLSCPLIRSHLVSR